MFKHGAILSIIIVSILQCRPYGLKSAGSTNNTSNLDSQSESPIRICGLKGFTESKAEHIINEISKPFVVRQIKGNISNDQGGWQKDFLVLFEIRGVGKDSKIMKTDTDKNGNFAMKNIPEGRYCFKATVLGWQSVMGIIFVDKKADPKNQVAFKMLLGV